MNLFLQYAHAVQPFRDICLAAASSEEAVPDTDAGRRATKQNPVAALATLPQDETCSLGYAGDMLRFLTDGLSRHDRVRQCRGNVVKTKWSDETSQWDIGYYGQLHPTDDYRELTSPIVVLCTGSAPATVELPALKGPAPQLIPLDKALSPVQLARSIPLRNPNTSSLDRATRLHTPQRVGVIGSSHSAVLVLRNLVQLARTQFPGPLDVLWFARSPHLKYAVHKDGYILYDNTGLKGEAAEFAREHLDGDALLASPVGEIIRRIDCSGGPEAEKMAFAEHLPQCTHMVQAVGFARNPLPYGESRLGLKFNHETGCFSDRVGSPVWGLYGAGIAFPERVKDPEGNVELAVGFWKFMRFLKRVVPEWVAQMYVVGQSGRSG